jgi:hypothetical protein
VILSTATKLQESPFVTFFSSPTYAAILGSAFFIVQTYGSAIAVLMLKSRNAT